MKSPTIIKNFLPKEIFLELQNHVKNIDKSSVNFDQQFSRYEWSDSEILKKIHIDLIDFAKEFFESETLIPSFNFASWYFNNASLEVHKDVAPCTYSIDLCVYQKTPWALYIDGQPYMLEENDAVLYYGESQFHWREDFPDPENNIVCNVFFFYIEPNHWSLLEPPEDHALRRRLNAIQWQKELGIK